MSKTWTFIGGMIAGVVSVFATAAAAVKLDEGRQGGIILKEDIDDQNIILDPNEDEVAPDNNAVTETS